MEPVQLIRDIVIIGCGVFFIVGLLVALIYVVPLLLSVRRLSDESTRTLMGVQQQAKTLGEVMASVRSLTEAVNVSHRRSIDPALKNVEEITERVNKAAREASYVVEEGARFAHTTLEHATFYRDRVFKPLIELASLWRGLDAVRRALPGRKSKRGR